MRFPLALIIALVAVTGADAQCVNGRCSIAPRSSYVSFASAPAPAAPYVWAYSDDKTEAYLYRGDVQVGGYNYVDRVYRRLTPEGWSEPTTPPVMIPADVRPAVGPEYSPVAGDNFGVDSTKIHPPGNGGSTYTHKGRPISRSEARELVAADPQIPDETGKLRVTVIGVPSDRAAYVAAYNAPAAADVRARTVLWEMAPDHWTVAEYGFVAAGKPTVYVQTIDADGRGGKVLHRQDTYVVGDKSIDAIRRAIKTYDSTKDLDLRVTASPAFNVDDFNAWLARNKHMLVGSIAVVGAAIYRRRHF